MGSVFVIHKVAVQLPIRPLFLRHTLPWKDKIAITRRAPSVRGMDA